MALEITKDNYDDISSKDELVVIDFWAQWCGPCRVVGPIIDALSTDNTDVVVGKVDVDSEPELSGQFNIRGIPCVVFLKGGEVVGKLTGAHTKQIYQDKINQLK